MLTPSMYTVRVKEYIEDSPDALGPMKTLLVRSRAGALAMGMVSNQYTFNE